MSTEDKKLVNTIKIWVGIIAFLMSFIGGFAQQTFLAGGYVKTVEDTASKTIELDKSINQLIKDVDAAYLRKDVFDQYVLRRDGDFKYIKETLDEIKKLVIRK